MPRQRRTRPSPQLKTERLRLRFLDDPFKGDTEALRAFLRHRLHRHRRLLGYDELCRRVVARGLPAPEMTREEFDALVASEEAHFAAHPPPRL